MPETVRATIPDTRISPDNQTVLNQLGLLQDLAGTWKGNGFNLIARPDFHHTKPPFNGVTDLYLQLNQTRERLKFEPIGSAIPNRGFGQDDIQLFGLTYLQQITDAGFDGALHIEPGIWVTQPPTSFPPESVPPPAQLVARMATIPHGNSVLAQGIAKESAKNPGVGRILLPLISLLLSPSPAVVRKYFLGGPELLLQLWSLRNQQLTEGRPPSFWRTPFKGESVEVDAIPPEVLRGMVRGAIERHIDERALSETRLVEEQERETLARVLSVMGSNPLNKIAENR